MNRLVGLETEYGCLTDDPLGTAGAIRRVRDWLFAGNRYGLVDQHQRDWDEPVGNGGFLFNGGRAYVDMGHMELCTAECLTLRDLVAQDRAGDWLLHTGLTELRLAERVGFIRNNIDHYSPTTFGCHENYLLRRTAPLTEPNVLSLLTFLTLRTLYTGAGRIGTPTQTDVRAMPETELKPVEFQISQRADFIQNDIFEWVQFNRAIINTRDEPLADPRRFRRLHLIHGDTSVLPWTLALKVGTTSMVLDLLEIDHLPRLALADSVATLRTLSRTPDGPWTVRLQNGRYADAVEMLDAYLRAARAEFSGRDAETDLVLAEWASALSALGGPVEDLIGRCDWVTKRWLFAQFVEAERVAWDSAWLKSQDLEFHHVHPGRSLAHPLARTPSPWDIPADLVQSASTEPPANSRAHLRSMVMRELLRRGRTAFVDWEVIDTDGMSPLLLLDPFNAVETEARRWIAQLE